jgi:ArsR family transcriptional regulator
MSKYQNMQTEKMADIFKALSNPHRLSIFRMLVDCCPPKKGSGAKATAVCGTDEVSNPCVSDLGKDLGIAPSTLSHHLKELSHAGLVKMERRGQHIHCCVDEDVFGTFERFISFAKNTKT